jgi:BolA family transcriptional regulator, general stress-responsive regulator
VRIQPSIERKLRENFSPSVLEVINESSMHSVPPGSETHFKVVVVSDAFEGKLLVERHRLVYDALADEMKNGLHALTITSRTPAEWQKNASAPTSPPCLGGSKTGR